jgi:nitrate reductase gamma subunit
VATLALIHDRLATSVLLFMAAVGCWGILSYLRGQSLSGSIAGALMIGQGLVVLQGAAGLAIYLDGNRPVASVHLLYGFTAALVLPFVWSYLRDRHPRQGLLLYSLIALFIAGLAIRGMSTGGS